MTTLEIMKAARAAWPKLCAVDSEKKNAALNAMADHLLAAEAEILADPENIPIFAAYTADGIEAYFAG